MGEVGEEEEEAAQPSEHTGVGGRARGRRGG